jgi:hypothetical protein
LKRHTTGCRKSLKVYRVKRQKTRWDTEDSAKTQRDRNIRQDEITDRAKTE